MLAVDTLPAVLPPPLLIGNLSCGIAITRAWKCTPLRCFADATAISWWGYAWCNPRNLTAYYRLSGELTQPTRVADILGPDHQGSRPRSRPCNDARTNPVFRNGPTVHCGDRLGRNTPVYGIPAIEKFSAADDNRVLEVNPVGRQDDLCDVRSNDISLSHKNPKIRSVRIPCLRWKRRPAHVSAAATPLHPPRSPFSPWNPHPAKLVIIDPMAIVKRD